MPYKPDKLKNNIYTFVEKFESEKCLTTKEIVN